MLYANGIYNSPVMSEGGGIFISSLFFKENSMHIIARLFKGEVFTNAVTFQWSLGCIILLFSFVIFTLSLAGVLYFVFFRGIHYLVRVIVCF